MGFVASVRRRLSRRKKEKKVDSPVREISWTSDVRSTNQLYFSLHTKNFLLTLSPHVIP